MKKQKIFQYVSLFIALVCFLLAIGIYFSPRYFLGIEKKIIAYKQEKIQPTPTGIATQEPSVEDAAHSLPLVSPTEIPPSTTQPTSVQAPTSVPATTFSVNLSLNGSSVGQITMKNGQNQCDVLQNALSQGKIQSLNMRYDNSLGTNGVYQINGVGKDNAVWWTYKVNGTEPGQGCSYVHADSNESIEWDYIGN